MDLTGKVVLLIILFGLLVVFIWYSRSRPAYAPVRVGPSPAPFVEEDVAHLHTPPKLGWNWWAFALGPIWYLAEGLWGAAATQAFAARLGPDTREVLTTPWCSAGLTLSR